MHTSTLPYVRDGVLGPVGGEPGMEPHHGLELGPAPGQFQRERASEAVADGGHPAGVGVLAGQEDLEPGLRQGADPVGVTGQCTEPLPDLLGGERLPSP